LVSAQLNISARGTRLYYFNSPLNAPCPYEILGGRISTSLN
jgi:hypothetical protein